MVSKLLSGLLFWLLLIFIGLITIAILLGWSTGIGWIIIKLLPFTLFEATLLAMLSSFVAIYLIYHLINLSNELDGSSDFDGFSPESIVSPNANIPADRFILPDGEETDETWFRYQIANDIYDHLQDDLALDESMGVTQAKELAVRLADVSTAVFRSRAPKPRSTRIRITIAQLKKQMNKMKLRPYDNDILQTAVSAINLSLSYNDELADVVRDKTWDDPL